MITMFQSGGVVMWPLLAVLVGILWLAVATAGTLASGTPQSERVERRLQAILFWGAISVPLGVLGTVAGLVIMTEAVALSGQVNAGLIWGGIGVSLVTIIFALVIFLVAAVSWFGLRQWSRRALATARAASV